MINKNLMLVAMLSMGTALTTLGKVKPALASLTPPTSYDYSYTWNATASEQYLNVNGVDSIPLYTRTADGAYYNYTSTFNVIDGLSVTQTFNRSNTTWQASGTSWKPDQDRIGSDNTTGAIYSKILLKFDNQTNKDYILYFDISSTTSSDLLYEFDYNGVLMNSGWASNSFLYIATLKMQRISLPAYSYFQIRSHNQTNSTYYFDAWYLKDLGISNAWQQGYDADTQGILTDYLGTDAQQIGWVLLGIAAILFVFKGGK
jgi:hypothetical protein